MIDRIGNTSLFKSAYLSKLTGCTVCIKADYHNPGMSSKDRPALYMIRDAERRGLLKNGYTVVEASSGNTAIGVAMVCRKLGYACHIFLNGKSSVEKRSILESLGARITLCTKSGDFDDPESTYSRAQAFCDQNPNSYYCNQYFNPANVLAHYEGTGPEIWKQSEGLITHFITGVGTGGTITGVGKYLKEENPQVSILGVDPRGSVLHDYFYTGELRPQSGPGYTIEGIGRNFLPGTLDIQYIDDFIQVTDAEAARAAHDFFKHDADMPGFSSGAVLAALHKIIPDLRPDDFVVLFFADHGCRYLSKLYNKAWLEEYVPEFSNHAAEMLAHETTG